MSCELCVDARVLGYRRLTELAIDFERYSLLLQCPDCRNLYDCYPEGRGRFEELTVAESRARYPGAL